jgi:hypothetical protein
MMNNKSFIASEDSLLAPSLYTAKTQEKKIYIFLFIYPFVILKMLKIVEWVVGLCGVVVSIPVCKPRGA